MERTVARAAPLAVQLGLGGAGFRQRPAASAGDDKRSQGHQKEARLSVHASQETMSAPPAPVGATRDRGECRAIGSSPAASKAF